MFGIVISLRVYNQWKMSQEKPGREYTMTMIWTFAHDLWNVFNCQQCKWLTLDYAFFNISTVDQAFILGF